MRIFRRAKNLVLLIISILFVNFISCTKINPGPEDKAQFVTPDGIIIVGKYVPPKTQDKLIFILLHGLASTKDEWNSFAQKLTERGYGYFAYDLRGHCGSCVAKDGSKIDFSKFAYPGYGSEWENMITDVDSAIKYLKYKGIARGKIGLIGASLGANISLIYASKHKFIPLVVLLSPGWNYTGLATNFAIQIYGKRPLALAASPDDKYAYDTATQMTQVARQLKTDAYFFEGAKAQHGVQMFDTQGKFENKLLDWIDKSSK